MSLLYGQVLFRVPDSLTARVKKMVQSDQMDGMSLKREGESNR